MSIALLSLVLLMLPVKALAVGFGSAPWVGESFNRTACTGNYVRNFGPWDYTMHQDKLGVVERAHFTSKVELLQAGENAAGPATDIDYTLTVFPNHHRALNSAMQFELLQVSEIEASRSKSKNMRAGYRLRSPVECYLQRAMNYSPQDTTTVMLYAVYQQRKGRLQESEVSYKKALLMAPGSKEIKYNYGLLLYDLERYSEARDIAKEIYADEFPLGGLKNKLIEKGYWD